MGLGRTLIMIGLAFVVAGVVISVAGRLPFRIGRLPGDIVLRGKNSTFYFPVMTSILVSVVLSFVLWLVNRR